MLGIPGPVRGPLKGAITLSWKAILLEPVPAEIRSFLRALLNKAVLYQVKALQKLTGLGLHAIRPFA